jgi:hypothetical protein
MCFSQLLIQNDVTQWSTLFCFLSFLVVNLVIKRKLEFSTFMHPNRNIPRSYWATRRAIYAEQRINSLKCDKNKIAQLHCPELPIMWSLTA